jgi:hypothetical protein
MADGIPNKLESVSLSDQHFDIWLKAEILKPEKTVDSRRWHGNHSSTISDFFFLSYGGMKLS